MEDVKLVSKWETIVDKDVKARVLKYVRREKKEATLTTISRSRTKIYLPAGKPNRKELVSPEGLVPIAHTLKRCETGSEQKRAKLLKASTFRSSKKSPIPVMEYNEYQSNYYSKHILLSRKSLLKRKLIMSKRNLPIHS